MDSRLLSPTTLPRALCRGVAIALWLVGASALFGGAGLVADPSGTLLRMPTLLLANTPFRTFLAPGLILFAVVGAGSVASGLLCWRRHALAGPATILSGAALMIYIAVEWFAFPIVHPIQHVYFAAGALLVLSGVGLLWPSLTAHRPSHVSV